MSALLLGLAAGVLVLLKISHMNESSKMHTCMRYALSAASVCPVVVVDEREQPSQSKETRSGHRLPKLPGRAHVVPQNGRRSDPPTIGA